MLTKIELKNFKAFEEEEIGLNRMTILSGLNGMGKSSTVQALLVIRQSYSGGDLSNGRLLISGDLADLGTGVDLLFEDAKDDEIGIALTDDEAPDGRLVFNFAYDKAADQLAATANSLPASEVRKLADTSFVLFSDNFAYLQAERLGPRKSMPLSESRARRKDVGPDGRFTFHVLLAHGDELLEEGGARIQERANSRKLFDQVDAWLQEISPGSHLNIEAIRSADAAVGGFSFDRGRDVKTRTFRATNVGFGLSYVLPVIVALLISPRNGLVIIENPEAHIHPRGQTMLGRLAARAAADGVQVLAETHSDHFMDGVRIEVRLGNLSPDLCAFNFFSRAGGYTRVESPALGSDGRLSAWPEGFFDQREANLATIISGVDPLGG